MFNDNFDEMELLAAATRIGNFLTECSINNSSVGLHNVFQWKAVCKSSLQLLPSEKLNIIGLLRTNMRSIYESTSWGWDEAEKQKELFNPSSRFVLLVNPSSESELLAFTMFRFEWDDEDEPEHPVLFCYEVQVDKSCQKQGLGRVLMEMLQKISVYCRMWKTMLTCFKRNESAMNFYKKLGFVVDSNSPSQFGHMDEDYEILSEKNVYISSNTR